jgi:hypothetical protein
MLSRRVIQISAAIAVGLFATGTAHAQKKMKPPFGLKADVAYAKALWKILARNRLVGRNAWTHTAHQTNPPHGAWVSVIDGKIKIGGRQHQVIVKNNYGGKGIDEQKVADNPGKYLAAITVMLRRPGYDPANKNWFWVKYRKNGSIDKNPKGMQLAGRVAKGMKVGCIACHSKAPGGDMIYLNNRRQ